MWTTEGEGMDAVLLRPVDAAKALSLSRSKIYELISAGDLAAVKIGGSLRVPRAALDNLVKQAFANHDEARD
jgi:excisionase family DNA binding protein